MIIVMYSLPWATGQLFVMKLKALQPELFRQ